MKKSISILGSTGSIGLNSLKIISKKKFLFNINILAANKNYNLICSQIIKFKPKVFIINDYSIYLKVKEKFKKKMLRLSIKFKIKKIFLKNQILLLLQYQVLQD